MFVCKSKDMKKKKGNCLYVYTTEDEFELPIYIEDSIGQLAEKVGTTKKTINYLMWRTAKGYGGRYHRVPLEEGQEDGYN